MVNGSYHPTFSIAFCYLRILSGSEVVVRRLFALDSSALPCWIDLQYLFHLFRKVFGIEMSVLSLHMLYDQSNVKLPSAFPIVYGHIEKTASGIRQT